MRSSQAGGLAAVWVAAAALLVSPASSQAAAPVQAQGRGTVVRVDPAQGKIAIRQGAISALDLPAMILVYHVAPVLLKGITRGDSVSFTAERADGQYRLVALEK